MSEDFLPWQQQAWNELYNKFEKLPHALLITGIEGIGKAQFACKITKTILCQNPSRQGACQKCKACQLVTSNTHPDLCSVQSSGKSEQITIESIRELTEFSQQSTQLSSAKVILLLTADNMNHAAQNALLKTLEEPNSDTYIILVSQKNSYLLATVRSRCQQFNLASIDTQQASTWLANQLNTDIKHAQIWLRIARGAPLLAKELALDESKTRNNVLSSFSSIVLQKICPLTVSSQWQKLPVKKVLAWLSSFLLDCIKVVMNSKEQTIRNIDFIELINEIAQTKDMWQLFYFNDKLTSIIRDFAKNSNLNKQLAFDTLLFEWQKA